MKNLLIATKKLKDEFFEFSVVLRLTETNGVILNIADSHYLKGATPSIVAALHNLGIHNTDKILTKIRLGGPVSGPMICIHKIPELGQELMPGVYWTYNIEKVKQILILPDADYRLYFGTSVWGADQLKNEIKIGAWVSANASTDKLIFNSGDRKDIWEEARKTLGNEFLDCLGIKHTANYEWN